LASAAKYRRGVFDEMLRLCEHAIQKVCGESEAVLREFNGDADHVHLPLEYPLKVSMSALMNSLQSVSAAGYPPVHRAAATPGLAAGRQALPAPR
jgi:REP-associated tyrosine transposase